MYPNIRFIQFFVAKILLIGSGFYVPFRRGAGVPSGQSALPQKRF
jgi:hypothetical protein